MADASTDMPPIDLPPEAVAATAMKLLMQDPRFKVGEAEIRGNTYRVFENAPPSLGKLLEKGAAYGDKEFIVFGDERLTHAEVWSQVCRFADGLSKELGVKKGDRVAIAMRNFPEWCVAYMAIVSLGAVAVPLNAWWKSDELRYGLQDSEAKIAIVDAKRCEFIAPHKEELGVTLILTREDGVADYRFEDILAKGTATALPDVDIHPEDDFCISYTSGSTGNPKGVLLTHRGVISTLMSWSFVAEVISEVRQYPTFPPDAGILLAVPLFHVTGSHSIFMMSWLFGRKLAFIYRWDAKEAADIIRREKLTNFVGVPSQSFELIEGAGEEGLPTLADIGSGGAKRPPDHVDKLKERFAHANPSSGYGLTETNALGCIISLGDYQKRPDSTGRAVPPITDIKIVKEDGADGAVGEVGEIWIRTPGNFKEYLNKPEETANALTADGWFKSGDLGRIDEEGFVYIVDRLKDLIIRGGENISCLEVENRAYEHDDVAEASAFSVPCDVLGERVGLVVVAKEGATIDPEALRNFMAEELAGFKVPERIWVSPAALPRLGTAKFDKRTIRAVALQNKPTFSV